MRSIAKRSVILVLGALMALPAWVGASAQPQVAPESTIVVNGLRLPAGPEIKGIISARNGQRMKVTSPDGSSTVIAITEETRIRGGGGLFGGNRNPITADSLVNGLPVTVKTLQSNAGLVAGLVSFKSNDLKTALMIRNGTAQQFDEHTAATEALRGRLGDIDKYNVKNTANVYFDSGKSVLSAKAKADLCATAAEAEATNNALLLVVGYADSRGSEELNQVLSEKRAGSVINYLQQACRWKPYRMLTPTGMAESDPAASNDTEEGRAQNRRVSVNILVSKGLDGM